MSTPSARIDWIIFDLGGVLIELDGPPISPTNSRLSEAEIWQTWLHSPAVRRYESGQCDRQTFARLLIEEFQLTCSATELLKDFAAWPVGFFPETAALLDALKGQVQLACLSNTNELHWQRFSQESPVLSQLDEVFVSFAMGLMKPDQEIFHSAQRKLAVPPARVLFLDDNQANVDAAANFGWHSVRVKGIPDVISCLKQYVLL